MPEDTVRAFSLPSPVAGANTDGCDGARPHPPLHRIALAFLVPFLYEGPQVSSFLLCSSPIEITSSTRVFDSENTTLPTSSF